MKTKIMMMLIASAAVMTACSSDDPFENAYNYMDPGMLGPGSDMMTGGAGGASAGTGEMLSFEVALDKNSAEPTSTVTAYYPETADEQGHLPKISRHQIPREIAFLKKN